MIDAISIASRGSPLARRQAMIVLQGLQRVHAGLQGEIIEYSTKGDVINDRKLQDIGGKGLFTKEIDMAVASGEADIAVHSMKDMETDLPSGLIIAAVLPRGDVRDAFLSLDYGRLADLPTGAVVGTSSLRRQAQILHYYPHLRVEVLRGNVGTRMAKLQAGGWGATLLALAGLQRLGLEGKAQAILSPEEMLPAVAQGALAVVCREGREGLVDLLKPLHCADSFLRVSAERAYLRHLGGSCRTPIAALAVLEEGRLALTGLLANSDGSRLCKATTECPAELEVAISAAKRLADRLRHAHESG